VRNRAIAEPPLSGRKPIRWGSLEDFEREFRGRYQHIFGDVKKLALAPSTCLSLASIGALAGCAQTMQMETDPPYPRIVRAIGDLEDAVAYMQAAPNYFGGHEAAALDASRAAVRELQAALAFRVTEDHHWTGANVFLQRPAR
jgi:hypothetical protein